METWEVMREPFRHWRLLRWLATHSEVGKNEGNVMVRRPRAPAISHRNLEVR